MLMGVIALCAMAGAGAVQPATAREWLAALPPLPGTAATAYAQWVDVSGRLKGSPAMEEVSAGLKAELLVLQRPLEAPPVSARKVSARDQALIDRITPFPGSAAAQQGIQAAQASQAELERKWRAELGALEQRRVQERSALPACHNEAGQPSQIAIRDVERGYARQKIAIAERYLAQFQPLVDQLKAAVGPRIEHGDTVFVAWTQLRHTGVRAQLAQTARAAESAALMDVETIATYLQEISKLAARAAVDQKALERVYARAKGC
jgi:hypothetical protein